MINVLVCGGRNFGNVPYRKDGNGFDEDYSEYLEKERERFFIYRCLDQFAGEHSSFYSADDNWLPSDIRIISGRATGVDSVAIDWAIVNWCDFKEYPADWGKHGKKAGILRNIEMLDKENPDFVLCFPGGRGTQHMKETAKKRGHQVIEYDYKV